MWFGISKNKNVLRNIINYYKIIKNSNLNIKFENYNIVIRNMSSYNLCEKLINIIAKIYYKNGIISNNTVYYLEKDNLKIDKIEKLNIEEDFIVINLCGARKDPYEFKKEFEMFVNNMPQKSFIILENNFCEGEINAAINEYASWSMKIDRISDDEKEKYIRKFISENNLICSEDIIKSLIKEPYWKIKNELLTILISCKNSSENNISKVIKKEKNNIDLKKIGIEELDNLTGLDDVKEQLKKVINFIKISKNRKNMPMLHMCFNGNPGTGKTTVARIVGKIFAEEKILSDKNIFIEAQRSDLIGKYVGYTAVQTKEIIQKSLGGVLFIDEAYSIASYIQDEAGRDYGAECIATLLKGMEDNRDNLCVILAGYTDEMEHMLNANPGFKSRIQYTINFPDYTSDELYQIFKDLCKNEKYKLTSSIKRIIIDHFDIVKQEKHFSNARYVRSFFEKVKIEQANRVIKSESNINIINKCDVENVLNKIEIKGSGKKKIGFECY